MLIGKTGTDAAGEGSVTTKESVRYFTGNEAYGFFTAMLTTGVAAISYLFNYLDLC